MIKLLLLLLPLAANATLVQGPDGAYNVFETGSGYNIVGVTGQGTTMVRNYGSNTVITAPNGEQTFIHGTDPGVTPIVPVAPGTGISIPNYLDGAE